MSGGDFGDAVNKLFLEKNQAYLMTKEPVEDYGQLRSMTRLGYISNPESARLLDRWWEETFGEAPAQPPVMGYVDNVWQMVRRGLGYTICFLSDAYAGPGGLALRPLRYADGSWVFRNTWLLWPKGKHLPPATETFVRYMRAEQGGPPSGEMGT